MKSNLLIAGACAAFLLIPSNRCAAILIADLKADYRPGTTVGIGQTSDSVGVPGTLAGTWHYYQDLDGDPTTSGDRTLLTWQQQGNLSNSGREYAGSAFEFLWNMPMLSAERLFDGNTPAPPAGALMGHPGSNAALAIEYRADPFGSLVNLSVDYLFQTPSGPTRPRIFKTGVGSALVDIGLISNNTQILGTVSVGTLAPGESLWLILSAENSFSGDQTWLGMTINAAAVPEASGFCLLALTLCALPLVERLRRSNRSTDRNRS